MYQFIFYFFALAFNKLHNLTKIILKLFADSKYSRIFVLAIKLTTKTNNMKTNIKLKLKNKSNIIVTFINPSSISFTLLSYGSSHSCLNCKEGSDTYNEIKNLLN